MNIFTGMICRGKRNDVGFMTDKNPQMERISQVFGTDEIPRVEGKTLHIYFEYLKERLACPCMLTGIESIRFFGWEERFEFGYGSQTEYKRLRREEGSYKDKYDSDAKTQQWRFEKQVTE